MMFQYMMNGANLDNTKAIWSLAGNSSIDTAIDDNGVLRVATNEASSVLVVTVTSEADPNFFANATVRVVDVQHAEDTSTVQKVTVLPETTKIGKGYNAQFAAQVSGVNNPSQDVVWKLVGN